LGRVVRTVAIGIGLAAAALVTGGAALIAGASVFAAVSIGATMALTGAQYLMRSNTTQPSGFGDLPLFAPQQQGPPPTPLSRTIRQADCPRAFIFGRTKTSGAYFFYESDTVAVTGPAPTTNADSRIGKFIYTGIYLCDGPIDGFDGILCDDEAFTFGSTGVNRSSNTPDGNDAVFIPQDGIKFVKTPNYTISSGYWAYINGYWIWIPTTSSSTYTIKECALIAFEPVNATEAGYNSYILNNLMLTYSATAMANVWSLDHRGKGVTCLYTYASTTAIPAGTSRIKYFPNGFPEWSVFVRGARIYDPRDTAQRLLHPATGDWSLYNPTWKFSENPALIAAHFVSWLIHEGVTAINGVDWDAIIVAANDCDQFRKATRVRFASDAFEVFARITGVFYFNTPPREFLANIMAACDGSYGLDANGRFTMWIGKWEEPAVIFDESDIGAFTEDFVESASEAMNEIHITYIEPRQNYQKFEAPTWVDAGSQAIVGKRVSNLGFDLVPSPNQAYRMAQRMARRINGKKRLTLTLGPRGMLAIRQRVVGVNAPNFGIDGVWRVESLQPDMTLAKWNLTLREITPDVFADDPPPIDPITQIRIVNIGTFNPPTYFGLTGVSTGDNLGYVKISCDINLSDPTVASQYLIESAMIQEQTLQFEGQYSLNGGATWITVAYEFSSNVLRTPDIDSGMTVAVRTRFVALNGAASAWSAIQYAVVP